jgi:hypothetical protein
MSEYKEQLLQMLNAAKDPEAVNFFIELALPILGKVNLKYFIADALFDDLKAFIFEHFEGTQYELNEIKSALEDMRYDFFTMLGWSDISYTARRTRRMQLNIATKGDNLMPKYRLAAKLIDNILSDKSQIANIATLRKVGIQEFEGVQFLILNEKYTILANLMRYFITYENQLS